MMYPYQLASPPRGRQQFRQVALGLRHRLGLDAREVAPDHWAFELQTRKQRSQVVHLVLEERSVEGEDAARLVASSPIGPVPRRCNFEWLMRQNAALDVGTLCVEEMSTAERGRGRYLMHRASRRLATLTPDDAWEVVHQVANVADRLEEALFVHDVY